MTNHHDFLEFRNFLGLQCSVYWADFLLIIVSIYLVMHIYTNTRIRDMNNKPVHSVLSILQHTKDEIYQNLIKLTECCKDRQYPLFYALFFQRKAYITALSQNKMWVYSHTLLCCILLYGK